MDQQGTPSTRPNTALLVGTDEVLLYTRKAILQKEGFQVSDVEPVNVVERLQNSSPDVIIACHTLTTEEADFLVRTARSMPRPPALVGFTKELSPVPGKLPFDATVWSLASPEALVGKVHQVLRRNSG